MALVKKAPEDPVAALEHERAARRKQAEKLDAQLMQMRAEVASLLTVSHGASLARLPLEQAVAECQVMLARSVGKAGEEEYTAKLYAAQEALAQFNKEHAGAKERIMALRAQIQQGEETLRQAEQVLRLINDQIGQEVEAAHRTALARIFAAMQHLLSIYEADGPSLIRMRNYDGIVFEEMMNELALDREQVFAMIDPSIRESAGSLAEVRYDGERPYLLERKLAIRERLSKLSG